MCTPNIPKPTLAPSTHPMFDSVEMPDDLCQRLLIERYGSMLIPGDGMLALTPPPAVMVVSAVQPVHDARPAPSCRLIETGIRLPPITRNAACPPTLVRLLVAPSGFQLESPAVTVRFARPSDARAPKPLPLP